MELIAAATIWGLFSCFLLFPLAGLPAAFHRTAMALLVAELLALALTSYGSGTVAGLGRAAASLDVPLLGVALVVAAILRGVLRRRRTPRAEVPAAVRRTAARRSSD